MKLEKGYLEFVAQKWLTVLTRRVHAVMMKLEMGNVEFKSQKVPYAPGQCIQNIDV